MDWRLIVLVLFEALIFFGILGAAIYVALTSIIPTVFFRGGPYVPSARERVARMITLADLRPTDDVMDLGSGDGRIIFAALDAGAKKGTGCEINPVLVKRSEWWARRKGYDGRAFFVLQSMFSVPLAEADVVFLYQLPKTMALLEEKLKRELKPGARIVSNAFRFSQWTPVKRDREILLYVNDT